MATRGSDLLRLQAPSGAINSSALKRVTDPISIMPNPEDRMRHFFEGLYNLAPESHLSRFVKTLLGDAGVGYLSKMFVHARTQSILATMRFADLDAFYGAVLGLPRMSWERTDPSRYFMANTPAEWDEIEARDASYRARIEAFSRSVGLGATPQGIIGIAESLLSVECRLYESYLIIDEGGDNVPPDLPIGARTYGRVEQDFPRYIDMNDKTYADIEGGYGTVGRTDGNDRTHFTIRPMRLISNEERHQLMRVMERFRPVGSIFSIDPQGVALHSVAKIRGVSTDSSHWEVLTSVSPPRAHTPLYVSGSDDVTVNDDPTYQERFDITRPALSGYQGEVWSYNSDIIRATAYREIMEGMWPTLPDPDSYEQRITPPPGWLSSGASPGLQVNFQRVHYTNGTRDYHPAKGVADHGQILLGRAASSGISTASPVIVGSTLEQQIPDPISGGGRDSGDGGSLGASDRPQQPPRYAPLPIPIRPTIQPSIYASR